MAYTNRERAEHELLWQKTLNSFAFWVTTFVMMWAKEGGDPIKFILWDFQKDAAEKMQHKKKLIFLKARQMGLSWLAMAYALWSVLTKKNFHVYITSIGLKEVQEQMERIRFMYYNLPEWMQEKVVLGGKGCKDNDSVMEFSNGSVIHAIASSKAAGHGAAPGLYILDELSRKENDVMMWRAVKPSIGKNTQVFIISTSNGFNNLYAELWFGAVAKSNDFIPVFYGAKDHPDYTDEYLVEMQRDFAGDLQGFKEAFPLTPEDAFLSASRSVFDVERIRYWKEVAKKKKFRTGFLDQTTGESGTKIVFKDDPAQHLVIWKEPEVGHHYAVGVDVAEGLVHGDWSVALVLDTGTREVVGLLRGKFNQEYFGFPVYLLAKYYNDAWVVVEVNKGADTIINDFKQLAPHLLYRRVVRENIWDKPTLVPGFYTHGNNKSRIIIECRKWFSDTEKPLTIWSDILLDEMASYEQDEKMKLGAARGLHDDCVMALALAIEGTTNMPSQDAGTVIRGGVIQQDEHHPQFQFERKGSQRDWRSL